MLPNDKHRCQWCIKSEIERNYHDNEWGVPLFDDIKLFEFLILDIFQAGLSWKTILNKRENFRAAFDQFEPSIISIYDKEKIDMLMEDPKIIRNRLKIESTINNAQKFLEVTNKYGSFSNYIWGFSNGNRIINTNRNYQDIASRNEISDKMSKEMKKFGFKFLGTTICYGFMQAIGMVNDHEINCYRYNELL